MAMWIITLIKLEINPISVQTNHNNITEILLNNILELGDDLDRRWLWSSSIIDAIADTNMYFVKNLFNYLKPLIVFFFMKDGENAYFCLLVNGTFMLQTTMLNSTALRRHTILIIIKKKNSAIKTCLLLNITLSGYRSTKI